MTNLFLLMFTSNLFPYPGFSLVFNFRFKSCSDLRLNWYSENSYHTRWVQRSDINITPPLNNSLLRMSLCSSAHVTNEGFFFFFTRGKQVNTGSHHTRRVGVFSKIKLPPQNIEQCLQLNNSEMKTARLCVSALSHLLVWCQLRIRANSILLIFNLVCFRIHYRSFNEPKSKTSCLRCVCVRARVQGWKRPSEIRRWKNKRNKACGNHREHDEPALNKRLDKLHK